MSQGEAILLPEFEAMVRRWAREARANLGQEVKAHHIAGAVRDRVSREAGKFNERTLDAVEAAALEELLP